jgi:hypothetical protein
MHPPLLCFQQRILFSKRSQNWPLLFSPGHRWGYDYGKLNHWTRTVRGVLDWEYQTFRKRAETRITVLGLTNTDVTKEDFFPLEQVKDDNLFVFYGLIL